MVGIDFGTPPARALVVRAADGVGPGGVVREPRPGVIDGILAATGEGLPPGRARRDPGEHRDVPCHTVPVTVWQPVPNPHTSAEAWLTAGGPHHTAYSAATTGEVRSDLAEMLGVESIFIDADTEMGRFRRQLRWSQPHYRLAQGF